MRYNDHALISARKFNCNVEDTLELHKLMDESKIFCPHTWQHRLFSHNTFFVNVIVNLYYKLTGKVSVPNTKTGGDILIRDILLEHLKEDFSGKMPSITDWLESVTFKPDRWLNNPDRKEINWLKSLNNTENE